MPPLRRVTLTILALLLGIVAIEALATQLQQRRFAKTFVTEAQSLLAERKPLPTTNPKHENGSACFAEVMATEPKWGTFSLLAEFQKAKEAPTVPDSVKAELSTLQPVLSALRGCGDARYLLPVDGVQPFDLDSVHSKGVLCLARATMLETRALAEVQDWESVVERCASTLEVSLDQSHVNLLGAISARYALDLLVPGCVAALHHLTPESRARFRPRFEQLPTRMARHRRIMEVERLETITQTSVTILDEEQRAALPMSKFVPLGQFESTPLSRFLLARLVRARDPVMRRLAEQADERGPLRDAALSALEEVDTSWWVPEPFRVKPMYGDFLKRFDDGDALLRAVAVAAAGGSDYPSQISRTQTSMVFTFFDGKTLELPLAGEAP